MDLGKGTPTKAILSTTEILQVMTTQKASKAMSNSIVTVKITNLMKMGKIATTARTQLSLMKRNSRSRERQSRLIKMKLAWRVRKAKTLTN